MHDRSAPIFALTSIIEIGGDIEIAVHCQQLSQTNADFRNQRTDGLGSSLRTVDVLMGSLSLSASDQ